MFPYENTRTSFLVYYSAIACFKACANWSGQDVGRGPHWIPSKRLIASLTSIPSINAATPWVFPEHPLVNTTFLTLPSMISKSICFEHTPFWMYWMIVPPMWFVKFTLEVYYIERKKSILGNIKKEAANDFLWIFAKISQRWIRILMGHLGRLSMYRNLLSSKIL